MRSFEIYFGCGIYYKRKEQELGEFKVRKFSEKIIPFFKEHNIMGVKALDFKDFCRVAELMKAKKHNTTSGLDLILEIKTGINRNRLDNSVSNLKE